MASTCLLLCTLLLALVYILPQVQSHKCFQGDKAGKEVDCAEFKRKQIEEAKAQNPDAEIEVDEGYDGWCRKISNAQMSTMTCGCGTPATEGCVPEKGVTTCCCKGDLCNANFKENKNEEETPEVNNEDGGKKPGVNIVPQVQVQSHKCFKGDKGGKEVDCAAENPAYKDLYGYKGWCGKGATAAGSGKDCGCGLTPPKDDCIEEGGITTCCCKGDLCNAAGNLGASPVVVLILWVTVAVIGKGLML